MEYHFDNLIEAIGTESLPEWSAGKQVDAQVCDKSISHQLSLTSIRSLTKLMKNSFLLRLKSTARQSSTVV